MDKKKIWATVRQFQSVIALIVVFAVAAIVSPTARDGSSIFLSWGNLTDMLRNVAPIGIMAVAMTFVILTAGIDLSVGSVLAFCASLVALLLTMPATGLPPALHIAGAILVAMLAGAAIGVLNGTLIATLKIQPFIITLAAMTGIRGLAKLMTKNTNINLSFGEGVDAIFCNTLSPKVSMIGTYLVVAVLFAIVLRWTVFGRYVRALGDNENAAVYSGLPIKRVRIAVYGLSGLLAGLASVLHCARVHMGSANDGVAYELEAIAAVVIGGTSLAGGKGSVIGTVVGTLIVGIVTNILGLANVDSNKQMIIKAVVIVVAVCIQQVRRRR